VSGDQAFAAVNTAVIAVVRKYQLADPGRPQEACVPLEHGYDTLVNLTYSRSARHIVVQSRGAEDPFIFVI
jgi:hypothetical protein